jgi:glycolate oxidase FAD binding subunit
MSDLTTELIDQVNSALTNKKRILIQGRGTKAFMGRNVDLSGEVVSTREHTGIIKYEPVELVMTARAGTTLAEIDAALEENNQMLACDPARFAGEATIGGSLATNQAGPSRPWIGSLRDHVLGVNLINGKGEHLRFGGQVMKNVAGYDVSRLQAGAMGTLGLITEISFKVLPKPASAITLTRSVPMEDAIPIMNELSAQPKPLTAATWIDGVLYLQLSGAKRAVEDTAEHWAGDALSSEDASSFWANLRDQQLSFFTERKETDSLWRFSIKSTAPLLIPDKQWVLDWAGAQRWLIGDYSPDELQNWASSNGGEVVLYSGGDRTADVFSQPNAVLKKIHQNVKNSLDPNNIFNIGRLYSWM